MTGVLLTGIAGAWVWAVGALAVQFLHARRYGRRVLLAEPAGDPVRGIAYAFGRGMSPTAKESVREHLPAYFIGVGYHAGIFAGMVCLVLAVAGVSLVSIPLRAAQGLTLIGATCGAILLARRIASPMLRRISCPDDFISNILATAFVGLSSASLFAAGARRFFAGAAIVLLLYLPLGKIRHCMFFFVARYHIGAYFGRRGTFPPPRGGDLEGVGRHA